MIGSLPLATRFALREMRSGLSGFLIFIVCIAIGVAAIGGVNSVARAISDAVADQGQVLLGGDIRFELNQREATQPELDHLRSLGDVAESANMRSMARLADGSNQALVEVKAIDQAYPLFGALQTDPQVPLDDLFAERGGVYGAAAPDLLFERLGLPLNATIRLGAATFELRAKIVTEPDAVSDGFGFAPRLMVSMDGLRAAGLIQPGSLVEYAYKVKLPPATTAAELSGIMQRTNAEFPEAGWSTRTTCTATDRSAMTTPAICSTSTARRLSVWRSIQAPTMRVRPAGSP